MLRRGSKSSNTHQKVQSKLFEFLDSSIWHLPIETFIEQRSIVFDRQQDDSSLYMQIHNEFAGLVDTLLECFCEDTGVKPEQLVSALNTLKKENITVKYKSALEPIAAAQNYAVFVPMMMRKNVELQLQALQMIEFMCGLIPSVLQLEDGETLKDRQIINLSGEDAERYVLISVLKQSKAEWDSSHLAELEEQFGKMLKDKGFEDDKKRLTEAVEAEEKALAEALEKGEGKEESKGEGKKEETPVLPPTSHGSRPTTSNGKPPLPPQTSVEDKKPKKLEKEESKVEVKENRPARAPTAKGERTAPERKASMERARTPSTGARDRSNSRPGTAKNKKPPAAARVASKGSIDENGEKKKGKDYRSLLHSPSSINSADLAARAAYLREQRDRLLNLKATEREKALRETALNERPKTAKAARGALRGQVAGPGTGKKDMMAARRAIVAKLKGDE